MAYTKHTWQNGKAGGTPINADRLNEVEDGIEAANETADDALGTANSASSVASGAASVAADADAKADNATAIAVTARETADSATVAAVAAQQTAEIAIIDAASAQTTADAALDLAQQGGGGMGGGNVTAAPPAVANLYGVIGSNTAGNITVQLTKKASDPGAVSGFVSVPGANNSEFTVLESGFYSITALVQSSSMAIGSGAYLQIVDKATPDPVIASGVPDANGWWYTLERNSVYLAAGTTIKLIFQGGKDKTYSANKLKFFVTIMQLAPIVVAGGDGSGGVALKYDHLYNHAGQVPANVAIACDFYHYTDTTTVLAENKANCEFVVNRSGVYLMTFTARGSVDWKGGWMGIKTVPETVWTYTSQDYPTGASGWTTTCAGVYIEAGTRLKAWFMPHTTDTALKLDLFLVLLQETTPVSGKIKHSEGTYTYAQVHGTPWNAGLVPDAATTTDDEFVTWQGGDGKVTINETGVYSVDATIDTSPIAAIGGTLGIGSENGAPWYAITDLASTASSGSVSLSNVYLVAGTVLRFYYNCKQGVNSTPKIGRMRITQIAAQPRAALKGEPRGLVAYSQRTTFDATTTGNAAGGGSAKPFLRCDCELVPGRTYRISTSVLKMGMSTGTNVRVSLGHKEGGVATVYNRSTMTYAELHSNHIDGDCIDGLTAVLALPQTAQERHSFLLDAVVVGSTSTSNQAGFRPSAECPAVIYVEDIGPYVQRHDIHPGPRPDDNPEWHTCNGI